MIIMIGLCACTSKINNSKAYTRNGLLYEIGSDLPFTGLVTGRSVREGYRRTPVTYKKQYKNGLLDGKSYFYYQNGKIESVEPYKKGEINGVVVRYYENGQMKARINFTEGLRGGGNGEIFWDEHGNRLKG